MNIAIIGRTEILYKCIELLEQTEHKICIIITSKEAPEYKIKSQNFRDKAMELGVKFIHTSNIMSVIDDLKLLPPLDLAISINYSGVIPQEITDFFKIGILNAHGGDLPRYRGNACQAWAILNGEKFIGLCVHKMIGGELDNGPIIARAFLCINIDTRIGEVYDWMYEQIPILMMESVRNLESNIKYVLEVQSKNPKEALRCYPRNPLDGRIYWARTAEEILRLINASSEPFSGAFSFLKDEKITIWRAEIVKSYENFLSVPGQVTYIGDDGIEVACIDSKLKITEVEIQGMRSNPQKFIKSIRSRFS